MVHFVGDDLRGWLLGYGLVALVGVAAWAQRTSASASSPTRNATSPWPLMARHWYRGRWPSQWPGWLGSW